MSESSSSQLSREKNFRVGLGIKGKYYTFGYVGVESILNAIDWSDNSLEDKEKAKKVHYYQAWSA